MQGTDDEFTEWITEYSKKPLSIPEHLGTVAEILIKIHLSITIPPLKKLMLLLKWNHFIDGENISTKFSSRISFSMAKQMQIRNVSLKHTNLTNTPL